MTDASLTCPLCGAPVAGALERCPMCGMARGNGDPSPFTRRWWLIMVGLVLAVMALIAVGTLALR